jgi:hypothetical protein
MGFRASGPDVGGCSPWGTVSVSPVAVGGVCGVIPARAAPPSLIPRHGDTCFVEVGPAAWARWVVFSSHSKNPGHAGADRVDGLKGRGLQDGLSALASGPPAGHKGLCPFVAATDDLYVSASYMGVDGNFGIACHGPAASGFPAGFLGLEPF